MRPLIKYFSAFVTIWFALHAASAQSADNDDFQSWNDVNFTFTVNKKLDLFFPTTIRVAENPGRVSEGKIGAGIVVKPYNALSISPFYSFIRARNSAGLLKTEHRFHLRFVYRFPTAKFGLSHRSQIEYRKRSTNDSWRYRPSITLEKALPERFARGFKVFVTEEPFYDSVSGRFSRNRLSFGIIKSISKHLSLDIYYLRQDDNFSNPGLVQVIGTAWKVKL